MERSAEFAAGIPVVPTDAFVTPFGRAVRSERTPTQCMVELTYRCNFDCVHCYVVQPHTRGELSTEEVCDALDQLEALGTLFLTFTGGEALTRPDFETIYLHAKRLGFLITVFTNAALIKEPVLELFRRYPPRSVEVTLYGASEATYEQVTQRRNMHQRVLDNVDRLLALGLDVQLKAIGLDVNFGELDALRAEAERRGVGERFRFDTEITPRVDCRRGPTGYRVPPAEVVARDARDPERVEEIRELYARSQVVAPRRERLFTCGAGSTDLVIDPYGKVTTCATYRREAGDLRQQSLETIWNEVIPAIVGQTRRTPNRCTSCDKTSLCASCAGNNALENPDDPQQAPDYYCEVTHLRVATFCADMIPAPSERAGRSLPLHRKQECQRPWLAGRRPVPTWFRPYAELAAPRQPRRGRPLPVSR